ncbi:hypothetical protein ACFSM5_15790 [Lacibacterium aquatile]|uniref:Secreted protein n=1 Tax=Lacibacterium aquatile TaxID=1168082 RepID=A0ABW5DY55_9PROT
MTPVTENFNRRRFFTCSGVALAGAALPIAAHALSIEPLDADARLEFAKRCGGDPNHDALMADVRAALQGKAPPDQAAELLATVERAPRCPLCGCPMPVASVDPKQPAPSPLK